MLIAVTSSSRACQPPSSMCSRAWNTTLLLPFPAACLLQEADKHGGGMASSLLGVAASAVHAVQEQLHNMLEHGRQLAAEQDAGAADVAAGGGSLAGGSVEGEREEEREGEGEGEVQERFGEGGRRSPVLPVPPAPQQPTMKVGKAGQPDAHPS